MLSRINGFVASGLLVVACSSGLPNDGNDSVGTGGRSSNGTARGGTSSSDGSSGGLSTTASLGGASTTDAAGGAGAMAGSPSGLGGTTTVGGGVAKGGALSSAGRTSTTGGTTTGGAPATGGGPVVPTISIVDHYATAGAFHGYAYTWATRSAGTDAHDTVITPVCSLAGGCTPAFALDQLCASGTVGRAIDWLSSAGLGFALSQAVSPDGVTDTPKNGVTLTGTGLMITYSNAGKSDLRIQLDTSVDGQGTKYCYVLGKTGTVTTINIPLTSFNTACWDNSGSYFSPTIPVFDIQLMVPCQQTADTPFNMCLMGVASSGTGANNTGTGGATGAGGTSSSAGATAVAGSPTSAGTTSSGGSSATGGASGVGGGTSTVVAGCSAVTGTLYFCDDFESGITKWEPSGMDWGTTSQTARSGNYSVTDSPSGNYSSGINVVLPMLTSVDLTKATAPVLSFWYKLAVSTAYCDYAKIQISTNSGSSWVDLLDGSWNRTCNTSNIGAWASEFNTTSWTKGQFDLTKYKGNLAKIQFRLMSAAASTGADGWYIDDVVIQEAN